MGNSYWKLDETKPDFRCKVCKYHRYIVVSMSDVGYAVIHSFIDSIVNDEMQPYLSSENGIHWWGAGNPSSTPPECLKSYKKVGGK